MDKNLTKKMESLLARVEQEEKRASSSFIVSMICRILVTALLVTSLTYIALEFKNMSQPKDVAIAINQLVLSKIPSAHSQLKKEMPNLAGTLARTTVKQLHKFIPMAGNILETQIERRFSQIMDHYKVQREQIIRNICSKVIDKIKKNKDLVKDETLASVLAIQLAEECDREAKNIINNAFFKEIDKLQTKVERLRSTPNNIMTRSQAAKKHLIVCWIYLLDSKGIDQKSIIGNTASLLGGAAENFISTQN